MKKGFLVAAAVAIALGGSVGRAAAQDSASPTDVGQVGRYQLVRLSDTQLFLIDTATGHCWSRTPDGDWRDEGSPTRTKPTARRRRAAQPAPALELPEKSVEMIVVQREERAIPGSDGSVRIRLGDITDGQVFLSVVTADDVHLLERTSVSQGDEVRFSLGKKRYVVRVTELRNLLIGDDFAKITVAVAPEQRRSASSER